MFGIMVGALYVSGYSPQHDLITYTGKSQAKLFQNEFQAETFIKDHLGKKVCKVVPF